MREKSQFTNVTIAKDVHTNPIVSKDATGKHPKKIDSRHYMFPVNLNDKDDRALRTLPVKKELC